jgi:hypothetical protein
MSYYPLSQITANLYTNGGEFTTQQNNPLTLYVGNYWKNSKGQFFTGKTPQDTPTQLLFKFQKVDQEVVTVAPKLDLNIITSIDFQPEISNYIKLKNINTTQPTYLPTYSPTLPTQQDYTNGEYRRYFCKKTNEIIYLEVSKDTYDKLVGQDPQILWQLYLPFNLPWQLTGSKEQVFTTNKNIVELASVRQKLPMLAEYLKMDFTKYYK